MRSDPKNRRAIAAIPAKAWVAIRYPNAVYDDQLQMWYSDAEVAEVLYTAFTSKKAHTTAGRMIVRRVRRLNPRAAEGQHVLPGMPDEVTYRYHAVFTSNPHPMLEAEAEHRDHAVFEHFRRQHRRAPGAPAVGGLQRQRRLGDPRRHHPEHPARRRRAGLAVPRQSQACRHCAGT